MPGDSLNRPIVFKQGGTRVIARQLTFVGAVLTDDGRGAATLTIDGGDGDIRSTGQSGGQSIRGTSTGAGTLTLSSGSADPVMVDGTIQADEVRTGDLVMESPERGARWRLIEHANRIEAVNEVTGQRQEIVIVDPKTAALLRIFSKWVTRLFG